MMATDRRGLLPSPRRRGHGEVRRQRVGYTGVRAFTGVPREGWGWRGSPAVAGGITPGLWGLGLASPWAREPTEGVGVELWLVGLHMMGRSRERFTAPWNWEPGRSSPSELARPQMSKHQSKEKGQRIDTCICINGSMCYTLETNTALEVNYTPIKIKI